MCIFLGAAAGAAGAAGAASAGIGTALSAFTTIASMGMGIAQAMASQAAANSQYQQQVEFRKQQEKQAQKTLNLQVAQQQAAFESEKGKAQGEKADIAIAAFEAASRASASAAESGVVGISLGNVLGTIHAKGTRGQGKIDYNSQVALYNANNELKMAQRGQGARLAEIPIPVKPSFAPTALAIGSSIIDGVAGFGKLQMSQENKSVPGYQNPQGGFIY
jgi:hypothetical protein